MYVDCKKGRGRLKNGVVIASNTKNVKRCDASDMNKINIREKDVEDRIK